MRAFLHLIKVPVLLLLFTSAAAFAWFKTRGAAMAREAAKESTARLAAVKHAMAEMTKRELGPPLPVIDGWSISEVESTHGQAAHKDKTTGWAVWPEFRAHFENGVVNQVEPLELK